MIGLSPAAFWGVYATMPFHPFRGIRSDIYYLGLISPESYLIRVGREESHTIGARFFGTLGYWDLTTK